MRRQERRFAVAVEEPGRGLCAPRLLVLGAFLDWLAKENGAEAVDSQNFQQCDQMSLTARGELMRLCKVAKVFLLDQARLVFSFGTGTVALAQ